MSCPLTAFILYQASAEYNRNSGRSSSPDLIRQGFRQGTTVKVTLRLYARESSRSWWTLTVGEQQGVEVDETLRPPHRTALRLATLNRAL